MSNEPIEPIEQNYVPYQELFPDAVISGVEVKDDLTESSKNTWSINKIKTELGNLNSDLTQAIEDIDLSPYEEKDNKSTDGTFADNSDIKYPSQKATKTYIDSNAYIIQNRNRYLEYVSFWHTFQRTFGVSNYLNNSNTNGTVASDTGIYFDIPATNARSFRPGVSFGGAGTCLIYGNQSFNQLDANWSYIFNTNVYLVNNALSAHHSFLVGLADSVSNTSIPNTDVYTSNALWFRYNPTLNGGNWSIIKVVGGVITPLLDTNIPFTQGINQFYIEYNKTTETAYFYLNGTLIHTQASINISDTVTLRSEWGLTTSSTSGTSRVLAIVDYLYGAKRNV